MCVVSCKILERGDGSAVQDLRHDIIVPGVKVMRLCDMIIRNLKNQKIGTTTACITVDTFYGQTVSLYNV